MQTQKIALLIDGENIAASRWPEIRAKTEAFGTIKAGTVIADFTGNQHAGWMTVCQSHGLQAVLQKGAGKGKNSSDIALTICAMDWLHSGAFDIFCVVSSDLDFSPLAQRLRQSGTHVMGIGEDKAPLSLRNSFDVYLVVGAKAQWPLTRNEENYLRQLAQRLCDQTETPGSISFTKFVGILRQEDVTLADKLKKGKTSAALNLVPGIEVYGTGPTMRVRLKRPRAA